jgi:hypothetical protein
VLGAAPFVALSGRIEIMVADVGTDDEVTHEQLRGMAPAWGRGYRHTHG